MTKILLIEDEADLREELTDVLQFEGYEIMTAPDGKVGIELAQRHYPDLIICDIMMPEVNGYDVLEALQSSTTTESIPFVFLTAKATPEHVREGMNLGADDYLTKPFDYRDLLLAVETRLAKSATHIEASRRKAQAEKERLIRHIAHELRNPLTGMELATALVEQHIGTTALPHLDTWLTTYKSGSLRLKHLIQQLVLETQLQSGSLNRNEVRHKADCILLQTIMDEAIEQGRTFARENRDLDIETCVIVEGVQIIAVADLMKHALSEIIANALELSVSNHPMLIHQWIADDWLVITFTSEGTAVTESQIKQALMPFVQSSHVDTMQKGLGIGLSLANQMIQLHGGTLHMVSAEGEGTTVFVRLPYVSRE